VLAVNKMGLVDFREEIFGTIADEFRSFAERLGTASGDFIPICATAGDNVVARSGRTGWYQGLSLLEHLETVPLCLDPSKKPFRLPVQTVIRQGDFRGYAGQIASGSVKPGDEIVALPSEALPWPDGDRKEAFAPQSVTLTLDKHLDAGRGDILADSSRPQRYSPAAPLQRPGLQQVRSRRKYPAR
jgi:sulfate adenylyltransferase subunit 1